MSEDSTEVFVETMSGNDVDREEFYRRVHVLLGNETGQNAFILTGARYSRLLQELKDAKMKTKKEHADYRHVKRYDIISTPNGERLGISGVEGKKTTQLFVAMEDIYDIIREYHLKMNHAGRTRLMYAIEPKYKNITTEIVMLYLSLCKGCKNKVVKRSRIYTPSDMPDRKDEENVSNTDITQKAVTDPLESDNQVYISEGDMTKIEDTKIYPELFSRGQMDILDVSTVSRDNYKYLMVYRNFVTKFIHLKALKSINIDESVDALLEIFLTFGAPNILQSKNGISVTKQICRRMYSMFPEIKVVTGDAQNKYSFKGQSNEEILKLLRDWCTDNKAQLWYSGIKYVQYILNNTFNVDIYRTPSESVFGYNPKRGIATFMGKDEYDHLITEKDLKIALEEKESGKNSDELLLEESLIPSCSFIKLEKVSNDDEDMVDDDTSINIETI